MDWEGEHSLSGRRRRGKVMGISDPKTIGNPSTWTQFQNTDGQGISKHQMQIVLLIASHHIDIRGPAVSRARTSCSGAGLRSVRASATFAIPTIIGSAPIVSSVSSSSRRPSSQF